MFAAGTNQRNVALAHRMRQTIVEVNPVSINNE